jgi:hypothetical protein
VPSTNLMIFWGTQPRQGSIILVDDCSHDLWCRRYTNFGASNLDHSGFDTRILKCKFFYFFFCPGLLATILGNGWRLYGRRRLEKRTSRRKTLKTHEKMKAFVVPGDRG